jgi:hypothetical protein
MSARQLVHAAVAAAPVVAVLALAVPPPTRAQEPEPSGRAEAPAARDTSLGGFFNALSDSTDEYFGLSAAPVDTAGLDTVLYETGPSRPRLELGFMPSFDFSRVDGSTPGLGASLGMPPREPGRTGWGKLTGQISRAVGSHTTLGAVRYENRVWVARQPFDVALWGGRATSSMNRDESGRLLPALRALCLGNDWGHYYRTDGFTASLAHEHGWWRAGAGWRDALQSPLATTATWNLARRSLELPWNLAAAGGRARELDYVAAVRWPRLPLRTELRYQTSSCRLGSDFEYRRYRAAAGLDLSLGRFASLVPQLAYGRLTGDAVPQASFFIGGGGTLRSLHRDERGGTGFAAAKLGLIGTQDLLEVLRVPHPAALPLQGELFTATSAVWGRDPYGGAAVSGLDWPDRNAWASEVGASVLYASPLFFGQGSFLHISYAWPIGPDSRVSRWSVGISRALDLLGPEPAEQEE